MEDKRLEDAAKEGQIAYTNKWIKESGLDTNLISDGYHTFGELYEHRIVIYMALCSSLTRLIGKNCIGDSPVWITKKHSDDSTYDGWFILGISEAKGRQITYHLPNEKWDECRKFARQLEKAPEYDGHTSEDVLERLKELFYQKPE